MAKKKKVVAAELLNQAPVVEFEAEPEPKPVPKVPKVEPKLEPKPKHVKKPKFPSLPRFFA
jgi:hypothetical protein